MPEPPNRLEVDASIAEAVQRHEGEWVTIGGSVEAVRVVATGGGERIARVTLRDFNAAVEVLVFARTLATLEPAAGDVLIVSGRVTRAARGVMVVAQLLERYDWQHVAEEPQA
jgi:DNA polymerase III alpha subunit